MKRLITTLFVATLFAGISGVAQASVVSLPDAGSTSSLIVMALGGLAILRRYVR